VHNHQGLLLIIYYIALQGSDFASFGNFDVKGVLTLKQEIQLRIDISQGLRFCGLQEFFVGMLSDYTHNGLVSRARIHNI
jgi:hypothetical protein